MAEEIGVIEYSVRAETAQAIASSKQMDVALSQIEKSAKSTDAGMHKLNTTMTQTARSVKQATNETKGMGGGIQQAGYQIQDFIVQVQGGTSAFVALGQQGSQLAGVLGPGGAVVGAVISLAAVIAQMAFTARGATVDLEALAAAGDRVAGLKLNTLVKMNDATRDFTSPDRLNQYQKLGDEVLGLTVKFENQQLATKRLREEAQAAQDALGDAGGFFGPSTAEANAKLAAANEKLNAALAEEAKTRSEVNGIQNQMNALSEEENKLKSGATKETKKYNEEQGKLQKQYDANEASLSRMAEQLNVAGLSSQGLARDAVQLAAAYSLNAGATAEQVEEAKRLAGALFDLNEQQKKQKELESQKAEAKKFTKQVAFDAASPLEKIDIEEQAKLAKLQEYKNLLLSQEGLSQQEILAQEQQFQTARNQIIEAAAMERQQIETARNSMILSASSDFFGGMADLAGTFAGEQSGAYKALFAISKGFAIANAALQLQTAIANASALPFPANLGAIGQAVTLGGQIASSIAGVSYGGGRQFGGPVNPGSMYRVGEGNAPELLSMGGSNYMIPGSRGQVTPMDGASGGVTFNITNQASDMVQTQQSYDPETRTVELAITAVANQMNTRTGKIGAAMKSAGAYSRLG